MKIISVSTALLALSVPLAAMAAQPADTGRPNAAQYSAEQQATVGLNAKVAADLAAQQRNAAAAQAQYKGAVTVNRAVAVDLARLADETDDAYAARLAAWRTQVAACNGGDKTACMPPPAK